jgi:hypothetical protein
MGDAGTSLQPDLVVGLDQLVHFAYGSKALNSTSVSGKDRYSG